MEDMKPSRRIWETEETRAFLHAYAARKEEFSHLRKKKFAMQNVLEDLIAQGVLKQPTTVELLHSKLRNLLRAYKTSKDNSKQTGTSPSFAPFEDVMDEIFGDMPIISNKHTLHLCGKPTTALPLPRVEVLSVEILKPPLTAETTIPTATSPSPNSNAGSESQQVGNSYSNLVPAMASPGTSSSSSTRSLPYSPPARAYTRGKINYKEEYYKTKLEAIERKNEARWEMFRLMEEAKENGIKKRKSGELRDLNY